MSSTDNHSDETTKSISGVFSKFADRTSMVGVGYINSSKSRLAKLAWTVLLLASMVALTFHLKYLFDIYYDWPKQTKVALGFSALEFPAVTICNVNPLRKSYLYMTSAELRSLVSELTPDKMEQVTNETKEHTEFTIQALEKNKTEGVNEDDVNLGAPFKDKEKSVLPEQNTKSASPLNSNGESTVTDEGGAESDKPEEAKSTPSGDVGTVLAKTRGSLSTSTLDTATRKSVETNTLDRVTRDPLETKTRKPLDTASLDPLETKTRKPLDTASLDPLETKTRKPLDTASLDPLVTKTRKPLNTASLDSLETKTRKPLDTASLDPVEKKTRKPLDKASHDPLNTKTRKPSEGVTDHTPRTKTHGSPSTTPKTKVKKKPPLSLLKKVNLNITRVRNEIRDEIESSERKEKQYDANADMLLTERSYTAEVIDEFKYLFSNEDRATRITAGHQMQDMLVDCSFSGRQCYSEHFSLVTSSTFGNCFSIDHHRLVTSRSGPTGGLQVILYLENEEYLRGITTGNGGHVVIHQSSTTPFPEDDGVALMAGTETNIALRMIRISRLGPPHGVCEPGERFKDRFGFVYTRQTCQAFCEQSLIVESCGCYNEEKEELNRAINSIKLPSCRNRKQVACMLNTSRQFERGKLECDCHTPCIEIRYEKMMSLRQWPSDEYAVLLVKSLCEAKNISECIRLRSLDSRKLANSFIKLNIYYEDLNYENITEEPDYEFVQFASDVGGTIGLWVGLSLLSMFEVLQFLMELGKHFLCGPCPRKPHKTKNANSRTNLHQNVRDHSLTMNAEETRSSHFSGY
ncbi:uncharacterized protein LOC121381416 [Gigantopelta aegis]|uniref:uncharacterized protein LOC121381416 n=1 Tax=Gigantopelta aegis TaxID=1735272 RepID=UPI001B88A226|nr:uncharacterized protein LOC121381416 [Gigantopelta aegis]